MAGVQDDLGFEAGDVAGVDEMGRRQEFQRAGGVDAPHDRFGFGRVIRAGTVADVVIRQIGVGAGGAGDAGLLRGGVPTGRGDYCIGG